MKLFEFKHYKVLKEYFNSISQNYTKHFMTFGKWHSYELLLYILSFTGESKVTITTFGLSEEGIRALQRAKKEGYISELTIIINLSARLYKKKLMFYLKNVADSIFLQNIHAKLFYIDNEKFSVIVNQSANFSTNPTNESGFVSTSLKDISLYKNFINLTLKLSKPFNINNNE